MPTALAWGRARSDLDVISRAGLPLSDFLTEATLAAQAVVPFVAACLATLDPATVMVASTLKAGALRGRNEADATWARIEYGSDDPTTISAMASAGTTALGVSEVTSGAVERSERMAELIIPSFDFHDEARVVFADKAGTWGALALFRGGREPFSHEEVSFLEAAAPSFTRGIRTGLLAQSARSHPPRAAGPSVLVVDASDRLIQSSPGALERLQSIAAQPDAGDPTTAVQVLVSAARRYARGDDDRMPRLRVRGDDGVWLLMHAAPLAGADGRVGDVVVTIEEARPHEVIELVAAAFSLTAREREIVAVLLRGADTKEIAATLHVSPYTVQDHLKSIFDKTGVASRRELIARIYFDQYADRVAEGSAGW